MAGNSNEDGDLSFSNRVTKERIYSDIDLTFGARTSTDGDVFKKTDAASVKQALKTLILTNRFEKPYKPSFGANLSGLIFELADEDTGEEILSRIKAVIQRYEPRVKILDIKVTAKPDYNTVNVIIEFRVVNTGFVDVLKVALGGAEECDPPFAVAPPPLPFTGNRLNTEFPEGIKIEGGAFLIIDTGP